MVKGPTRYVPPTWAEVVEEREAIVMDKNEGIYVRDLDKGDVRIVKGQTYLLETNEVLVEKNLDSDMERLIYANNERDPSRAVTFRIKHNEAIHIQNNLTQQSKVVLGPQLVMLEYDEHITRSVLSGGTPKKEGMIQALAVRLGPEFMTDEFQVETSNNATMKVQLSYNWYFDYDPEDQESLKKIFNVRDFVGYACSLLRSRVVAEVSTKSLDEFHKNSAKIIRSAIFKQTKNKINDIYVLENNNFTVTNVDIKSVSSVDEQSKSSMQESVKMAIQISTDQVEATAKAEAERVEQEAKAFLDRQKTEDEKAAEKYRKELYALKNETESIQKTGLEVAQQRAKAEANKIMTDNEMKIEEIKSEIKTLEASLEIECDGERDIEVETEKQMKELEIGKSKSLEEIESSKFEQIIAAIGKETIVDIANAGPELQAKLLEGLGLSGYLMMDSNNPVNLFQTAEGMIKPGGFEE